MKAEENTGRTHMSVDNTNDRWRWMATRRTRSLEWRFVPNQPSGNLLTRVETTAEAGHEAPTETVSQEIAISQINARSMYGDPSDSVRTSTTANICWKDHRSSRSAPSLKLVIHHRHKFHRGGSELVKQTCFNV